MHPGEILLEEFLKPLELAQLFKTTPQFWMHMQANFDLKSVIVRRRALKVANRR